MPQVTAYTEHHLPQTRLLIRAVKQNRLKAAHKLLKLHANPSARVANKNTLLHICTSAQMAQLLISYGAMVNARNENLETPLHTSMRRGLIGVTEVLIGNRANVNAQDIKGTTALHLAESLSINALLLDHGADPNLQDEQGNTPLHVAINEKGSPIISELVERGAERDLKNKAGENAFDLLRQRVARRNSETAMITKSVLEAPEPCPTEVYLTDDNPCGDCSQEPADTNGGFLDRMLDAQQRVEDSVEQIAQKVRSNLEQPVGLFGSDIQQTANRAQLTALDLFTRSQQKLHELAQSAGEVRTHLPTSRVSI